MQKRKMILKNLNIDNTWTLFLDRDGVINKKIENDYVKHSSEFEFIDGALNALRILNSLFKTIIIVTNQQCIGKRIILPEDLELIHKNMLYEITYLKGRIDKIYYAPYLESENHPDRKPGIGMAIKAKKDFPSINFNKSIMVGDSMGDMDFGRNAGMKTVFISNEAKHDERIDLNFRSLIYFAHSLSINS
jgi:histidinol-phosphate phosphatase family protein